MPKIFFYKNQKCSSFYNWKLSQMQLERLTNKQKLKTPANLDFCIHAQSLSCVWLFATPWTVAHQAPLSMGCSRQEYWSGLPFPSPGGPQPKDWNLLLANMEMK